ncbi:hypothetical protein [uncultured Jannaschia sp.]|uniref:hypothetical protein n=1 Tax=uncultured Jannaschia sp. TaxID=293347 RepID=UPI00262EFA02|nr:hypothetical protein [uncultured Jannaschia sp.]
MTRLILAALLSTALAGQASALSCLRPSVQSSFQAADTSEADYVLAIGRVQPLPGEEIAPADDTPNDRKGYSARTRFDGEIAGADGFDTTVSFPLTVEVECAGHWCGGVPLDRNIMFVERRGEENVLIEGPCPRFALDATPEAEADVLACLRGEACTPPS